MPRLRLTIACALFALLQATNIGHALTFGRIATITHDNAGTSTLEIVGFCFDNDARTQISTMTVGGLTTSKAYDGLGRLDTLITGASGAVQNLNVDFDIFGNLKARSDASNGVASAR